MKIAIIWKWWAGKTMISVILINLLKKYKKIVAIDADANKNIIDYVFPEIKNTEFEFLRQIKVMKFLKQLDIMKKT